MDGKTAIFCIVAYLIPSAWESIAHKQLLHATARARIKWRQWGWLGQQFRLAHFYHNHIHHHRTYRSSLLTQFSNAQEKEHLDTALKGEIAERLHANRYGTTITAPWETLTHVAVPLIVSLPVFASFAPGMLPISVMLSFGPYLLTKYIHPLLHVSSEEIAVTHGRFFRIMVNTRAFKFLQTYHHQHHRNESRNYNLMLGADWVILIFVRVLAHRTTN